MRVVTATSIAIQKKKSSEICVVMIPGNTASNAKAHISVAHATADKKRRYGYRFTIDVELHSTNASTMDRDKNQPARDIQTPRHHELRYRALKG